MNPKIAKRVSIKGGINSGISRRINAEKRFYKMERTCFYCLKPITIQPHEKLHNKEINLYCDKKCAAFGRWRKYKILKVKMTYKDLTDLEKDSYKELDREAKKHELVRTEGTNGRNIRFKTNKYVKWCLSKTDLNTMFEENVKDKKDKDLREFYRNIGYSLDGYLEIFY